MPTRDGRRRGGLTPTLGLAWLTLLAGLPAAAADRSTCKYFSQLPDDCADAAQVIELALRGYRFMEIDLFARDVIKKVLYVSVYNTTGQNEGADSRDSAPEDFAAHVDLKKVTRQYQALLASASPPRYWALDWLADRFGAVRNFGGLDAAWMGNGPAAETRLSAKRPSDAYRLQSFPRTSIEGFRKGTTIGVLDDPKGRVWVLAAYTGSAEAGDSLAALGARLKPPAGWTFRTVTLDRDLILEAKVGTAAALEDDAGDLYHLAGQGQSNFTP